MAKIKFSLLFYSKKIYSDFLESAQTSLNIAYI